MERIWYLCPTNQEMYRRFLYEIGPKLDDAGISFHICRPSENIPETIFNGEVNQ